ncbi:transcriptional regulator [Halobellus salinus]|uniref:Transcriptional regulator n=1 Tax=Halobellus salinus TaxID=931585 RepID=A0A830ETF3_9EURY|nr:Lrp/AsnC ligand binding domain-containing protein [Halobellus salinus]GGJ08037.1 transcriptional regulator [Halobellus salinus]SMP27879.1 transcriptional regulator, AsnC family [Halobellus salinus]
MITAYVMVKASSGDVGRLKREMAAADDTVEGVSVVAGDIDYIVKLRVDGPSDVKAVAASIHEMVGIEDTRTYIAMD